METLLFLPGNLQYLVLQKSYLFSCWGVILVQCPSSSLSKVMLLFTSPPHGLENEGHSIKFLPGHLSVKEKINTQRRTYVYLKPVYNFPPHLKAIGFWAQNIKDLTSE